MSTEVALPAIGLAVDQHPGLAPKGAMSQADNVVGDLPGVLRVRPGLPVVYSEDGGDPDPYATIDTLVRIDDAWVAHQGGTGPNRMWRNQSGAIDGYTGGAFISGSRAPSASARGSTYLGTNQGVGKLESKTSSEILAAGVEMALAAEPFGHPEPDATVPGPFTGPFAVGYRLVVKRTDANGYVMRSAPSMIFAVTDSSTFTDASILLWGNAADEQWSFPVGSLRSGDVVEFYRTPTVAAAAGPLGPDYYLVATYELDATDAAAGFFPPLGAASFNDALSDDRLGEALYTNPSRGGALAAKYPPPIAGAMALWSGAMWYGNQRDRERAIYKLNLVGSKASAAGVGYRAKEGNSLGVVQRASVTWSSGVDTFSLANVDNLVPGMSVYTDNPQSSVDFPAETTILSITGAGPYTVTLSAAPTTSDTDTVFFGDVIEVDGVPFYAHLTTPGTTDRVFGVPSVVDPAERVARTAYAFALVLNAYSAANDFVLRVRGPQPLVASVLGAQVGQLVFEASYPDGQFSIGPSTAPDAFAPAMDKAIPYGATVRANRLSWSDPDEPEAVRLLSFVDVGAENGRILDLTPLHDALLVWKDDGLFRVTGAGPDRWSVDIVDPTLVLSRPGAVDVMRGMAYAITNRGAVAVNEGGVAGLPAQGKVETLFRSPTNPMVVTWERLGLVLFADGMASDDGQGASFATRVYCLSVATGVWSRWPAMYLSAFGAAGSTYSPFAAATRVDIAPDFEVREFDAEEGRGYDNVWTSVPYTVGPEGEMVVADADRGAWYPSEGDWVQVGFLYKRVLGVLIDGSDFLLTLDVPLPIGGDPATANAYEGTPVQFEWLPSSSGSAPPFSLPVWRRVAFSFSNGPSDKSVSQTARLTLGVRDDFGLSELTGTPQRPDVAMRPYVFGWPRNSARRAVVWLRLGFSEILWPWRLSGAAYVGEGGSEKVRR